MGCANENSWSTDEFAPKPYAKNVVELQFVRTNDWKHFISTKGR